MSARWYKRCGADFIHGTMKLTLEEKGAYSLCLDLIYDRGGPIPDDARWLSGICGVSIRKWNAIRARLLELGKLAAGHDMLSNARADLELISAALSSRERAESGAKGGRKRAENAGDRGNINDLGQAELKREEKIREEENVEASASTVRARIDKFPCPEGVDPEHWRDFRANRKLKRLAETPSAHRRVLSDLAKLADDEWPPGRILEFAAARGWGAIFDPRNSHGSQQIGRSGTNGMGRHQSGDGLSPTTRAALAVFGPPDPGDQRRVPQ